MLENEKIRLRALEPEDLDFLYKWENEADLWVLGDTLTPFSRYDLKQYISSPKDMYESKQLRLMIDFKTENKTIGTIDLYNMDFHNRKAAVGILIDETKRNGGLATEALTLLCEYAFSFLKLHQLYAYIPEKNNASRRLFERCDFKRSGVLKDWINTTTGFENVLIVSLISDP